MQVLFRKMCESFKIGKKRLVVKVDTFVESTDLPPGMKLEDVARKSIVSCVSDFAAKGVKPIFGIISLTIPKKLSRSDIQSLAKGFQIAIKTVWTESTWWRYKRGKRTCHNLLTIWYYEKNCKTKWCKN